MKQSKRIQELRNEISEREKAIEQIDKKREEKIKELEKIREEREARKGGMKLKKRNRDGEEVIVEVKEPETEKTALEDVVPEDVEAKEALRKEIAERQDKLKQIKSVREVAGRLKTYVKRYNDEIARLEFDRDNINKEKEDARIERDEILEEKDNLSKKRKELDKAIKHVDEKRKARKETRLLAIKRIDDERDEVQTKNRDLENQNKELYKEIEAIEKEIKELQEEFEKADTDSEKNRINDRITKKQEEAEPIYARINGNTETIRINQERIEKLNKEGQAKAEEYNNLDNDSKEEEYQAETASLNEELKQLDIDEEKLDSRLAERNSFLEEKDKELEENEKDADFIKNERLDLTNKIEYCSLAIDNILDDRNWDEFEEAMTLDKKLTAKEPISKAKAEDPKPFKDWFKKMDDEAKAMEEAGEKVVEEKVAEEKAAEEKPVEEKVAEEKATEEKATEEKPAEEKADEEKAAEEKPARKGFFFKNYDLFSESKKGEEVKESAEPKKTVIEETVKEKAAEEKIVEEKIAESEKDIEDVASGIKDMEEAAKEEAEEEKYEPGKLDAAVDKIGMFYLSQLIRDQRTTGKVIDVDSLKKYVHADLGIDLTDDEANVLCNSLAKRFEEDKEFGIIGKESAEEEKVKEENPEYSMLNKALEKIGEDSYWKIFNEKGKYFVEGKSIFDGFDLAAIINAETGIWLSNEEIDAIIKSYATLNMEQLKEETAKEEKAAEEYEEEYYEEPINEEVKFKIGDFYYTLLDREAELRETNQMLYGQDELIEMVKEETGIELTEEEAADLIRNLDADAAVQEEPVEEKGNIKKVIGVDYYYDLLERQIKDIDNGYLAYGPEEIQSVVYEEKGIELSEEQAIELANSFDKDFPRPYSGKRLEDEDEEYKKAYEDTIKEFEDSEREMDDYEEEAGYDEGLGDEEELDEEKEETLPMKIPKWRQIFNDRKILSGKIGNIIYGLIFKHVDAKEQKEIDEERKEFEAQIKARNERKAREAAEEAARRKAEEEKAQEEAIRLMEEAKKEIEAEEARKAEAARIAAEEEAKKAAEEAARKAEEERIAKEEAAKKAAEEERIAAEEAARKAEEERIAAEQAKIKEKENSYRYKTARPEGELDKKLILSSRESFVKTLRTATEKGVKDLDREMLVEKSQPEIDAYLYEEASMENRIFDERKRLEELEKEVKEKHQEKQKERKEKAKKEEEKGFERE